MLFRESFQVLSELIWVPLGSLLGLLCGFILALLGSLGLFLDFSKALLDFINLFRVLLQPFCHSLGALWGLFWSSFGLFWESF